MLVSFLLHFVCVCVSLIFRHCYVGLYTFPGCKVLCKLSWIPVLSPVVSAQPCKLIFMRLMFFICNLGEIIITSQGVSLRLNEKIFLQWLHTDYVAEMAQWSFMVYALPIVIDGKWLSIWDYFFPAPLELERLLWPVLANVSGSSIFGPKQLNTPVYVPSSHFLHLIFDWSCQRKLGASK